VNYNPEKDNGLEPVKSMREQRLYLVRPNSLQHLDQVVPTDVNAEIPPVTPIQGVVRMNLDQQSTAKRDHDNLGEYTREVIDKLFEEKNAA
jgi:hypothetical protein